MCSIFFLIKLNSEAVFKSIVIGLCRDVPGWIIQD